jgi:hypothetical protein
MYIIYLYIYIIIICIEIYTNLYMFIPRDCLELKHSYPPKIKTIKII